MSRLLAAARHLAVRRHYRFTLRSRYRKLSHKTTRLSANIRLTHAISSTNRKTLLLHHYCGGKKNVVYCI